MSGPQVPPALLVERLRESPFFGALGDAALAHLGANARHHAYQAGELVFGEGEPSQGLFWLQSGTLKAVKVSAAGREQVLHFVRPGQTFNEVGSFSTLPNPASVVALTACQVWRVPREAIKDLLERNPRFAQMIIDVLARRLRDSVDLIEDLSLRTVLSRLSRLILEEAEGGTLSRPAWYTQGELAARLGTVTDVVQRALRKLEEDGFIRVERRGIHVIDRNALEALAN